MRRRERDTRAPVDERSPIRSCDCNREVADDVRDILDAGGDLWYSSCRMLSDLILGLGEAVARPSCRRYDREFERLSEESANG